MPTWIYKLLMQPLIDLQPAHLRQVIVENLIEGSGWCVSISTNQDVVELPYGEPPVVLCSFEDPSFQ